MKPTDFKLSFPRRSAAREPHRPWVGIGVAALLFWLAANLLAISVATPDSRIPLTLLLKRQTEALKQKPDSYWHHRGLARSYALAAAWKLTGTDQVRAGGYSGDIVPLLWCDPCAHVDYRSPKETFDDNSKQPQDDWLREGSASARRAFYYRERALHHYRRALLLGLKEEEAPAKKSRPGRAASGLDVDQTELGLAWTLLQTGRAEDRSEAKARLKEVIARQEKARSAGPGRRGYYDRGNDLMGPLISEAVDYLLPIMDEDEKEERERLTTLHDELGHYASAITPLTIDLRDSPSEDLVDRSRAVEFDLDGMGRRPWSWPRPGVAWLVWDPDLEGKTLDGSRLFGNRSFHLVHPDGFAALCMLDADADGWLRGVELRGLALWQDGEPGVREGDGRSRAEEMVPLGAAGIVGLQCRRDLIDDDAGHLVIRGGVERSQDGVESVLDLWDLVLVQKEDSSTRDLCPREDSLERLAHTSK